MIEKVKEILDQPIECITGMKRACEGIAKYITEPYQDKFARQIYQLFEPKPDRPRIICLCGSTRFIDTFNEWRKRLTIEGYIVLSIEIVTSQSKETDPQFCNLELKQKLDELHLRKIDISDEVFVLNVDGYIGESTSSEIAYAQSIKKPIEYLEEE